MQKFLQKQEPNNHQDDFHPNSGPTDNIVIAISIMKTLPPELILKIASSLIEIDRWVYYNSLKHMGIKFPGMIIRNTIIDGKSKVTCSASNLIGTGNHSVKKYHQYRIKQLEEFKSNFEDLEFGSEFDVDSFKKQEVNSLVLKCNNIILRHPDIWLTITKSYQEYTDQDQASRIPISHWASKISSMVLTLSSIENTQFDTKFDNLKFLTIQVNSTPSDFFYTIRHAIKYLNPGKTCLLSIQNEIYINKDITHIIYKLKKLFPNLLINFEINTTKIRKHSQQSFNKTYETIQDLPTIQNSLVSINFNAIANANQIFDFTWLQNCSKLHKLSLSFSNNLSTMDQDHQINISSKTLKFLKIFNMNYKLDPLKGLKLDKCTQLTSLKFSNSKIYEQMTRSVPDQVTYIEFSNCEMISKNIQLPLALTIFEFVVTENGDKCTFPDIVNMNKLDNLRLIYYGVHAIYTPEKKYWTLKKKYKNSQIEFYRFPEKRPMLCYYQYKWSKLEDYFEKMGNI